MRCAVARDDGCCQVGGARIVRQAGTAEPHGSPPVKGSAGGDCRLALAAAAARQSEGDRSERGERGERPEAGGGHEAGSRYRRGRRGSGYRQCRSSGTHERRRVPAPSGDRGRRGDWSSGVDGRGRGVPMGGDAAAHLYRTVLVRGGALLWDNLWFGGQYPLTSYSVLYYFVAGWIGNVPLSIAAIIVSATLFSLLLRHEWGEAARWPAWIFAVIAAGQLFTGSYDYVVGFAVLLSSLFFFQQGKAGPRCRLRGPDPRRQPACVRLPRRGAGRGLAPGASRRSRRSSRRGRPAGLLRGGADGALGIPGARALLPVRPVAFARGVGISVLGIALGWRARHAEA